MTAQTWVWLATPQAITAALWLIGITLAVGLPIEAVLLTLIHHRLRANTRSRTTA